MRLAAGHIDLEQAQILLRAEYLQSPLREFRGHDDLQKDRLHQFGRLARHLTVHGDDAAEDRDLIGLVGLRPRIHDIASYGRPAGIHVLESHAERFVELAHDVQCGIGVLNIVIRQLLAVELLGMCQRKRNLLGRTVELGCLVRVLAVAERLY